MENTDSEQIRAKFDNFKLETAKMNDDDFQKSPYILIRHALSEFNYKSSICREKYGDPSKEFSDLKADPAGFDPEIHAIGIE